MTGLTHDSIKQELSRRYHLDFMKYSWMRSDAFIVGLHTKVICKRLDKAFADYRNGISSYLSITVPYRHGKSDIGSRYLPPHFLGEFPNQEVMVASYSASLSQSFSKSARQIMRSEKYKECYPHVSMSQSEQAVDSWGVSGSDNQDEITGHAYWTSVGGTMTGKGFALGIIDDPFKGREEAESEVMREKIWDGFRDDFLTRAAPVHIIIVLATAWHINDLFGKIDKAMKENAAFPRFERIIFPAFSEGNPVTVLDKTYNYKDGVLFPERFSKVWYEAQKAGKTEYSYNALLQGVPTVKGGKVIKVDRVKYYDETPENIYWTRGWDLASSEEQRTGEDPDYTAGVKVGVVWTPTADPKIVVPTIYIDDVIEERLEAPARNELIVNTAIADGKIPVGVEAFGGYKDAYTTVASILKGVCTVKKMQLPGNKMAKWDVLEAPFASGNVWLKRAPWNERFLRQLGDLPSASHDDQADGAVVAFAMHEPHFNMVLRNFNSNNPKLVKDFELNWDKAKVPPKMLLHYAAVAMTPDLRLHIVCAIWDNITGHLYVYHAETVENISPDTIVPGLIRIMRLESFYFDEFIASKNMFSDNKSLVRVMNKGFSRQLPHQSIRLREPRKYDMSGAVAIANQMVNKEKLILHISCSDLALNLQQWVIEKGKVTAVGLQEALLMLISELETRLVSRQNPGMVGYKYEREAYFGNR